MKITVSAERYDAAIRKWLMDRIATKSTDIIAGVDVTVYKERCAEVRMLKDTLAALDEALKKAKND